MWPYLIATVVSGIQVPLEKDRAAFSTEFRCDKGTHPREDKGGKKWCETSAGVRHGPVVFGSFHDETYIPFMTGSYKHGRKHGVWRYWGHWGRRRAENSVRIMREETYVEGKREGYVFTWDMKGNVDGITPYIDDRVHGLEVHYHRYPDQMSSRATYSHGEAEGEHTRWHRNGQCERRTRWVNGRQHGAAMAWYSDGSPRWVGNYRDGTRVGTWKEWTQDGRRWEGEYRVDSMHGSWQLHDAGGKLLGTNHVYFGDGTWKEWNADGEIVAKGELSKGERNGRWTLFRPDLNTRYEGEYLNGDQVGMWSAFNDSSKLLGESEMHHGHAIDWKYFWSNGNVAEEGTLGQGRRLGCWRYYTPQGRLVQEKRSDGGVPCALVAEYYESLERQREQDNEARSTAKR